MPGTGSGAIGITQGDIAAGETGATFTITTHTVTAKTKAAITAGDGNITRVQTLSVTP